MTESSSSSSDENKGYESEEFAEVETQFEPYTDEPLAPPGYREEVDEESNDPDGLRPQILADREDEIIPVQKWCQCQHCAKNELSGALEHRCCREIENVQGKLTFDGSIENLSCITLHEDYRAMTNKAVLQNVAPLLKARTGQAYRRRTGVSENEFLRLVAYRWIIRWICGYIGWGNTCPLFACIYNDIRTRYQTRHLRPRGYQEARS
ncbi:uncharacterized protein LOC125568239 [Nematostella vectensis]|uniref:uncharacterized protein LOC125568239 n=1 Tax=Nematostella vectensis TaxID=45351 RepID=UPI002076EA03|nr:uncharacterized protein LOC125568239 [Nematostella vectensis]